MGSEWISAAGLVESADHQATAVHARRPRHPASKPVAYDLVVRLAGGARRVLTRRATTEEDARRLAGRASGVLEVLSATPIYAEEFRRRFLPSEPEGGES